MKKLFMMIALMAMPFAMQAQTKFHDVEANEATGAVKCIKTNMMGREQVINFTKEGKMQSDNISDAKYDENGYLLSAKRSMMGQEMEFKYKWENGRVVSQSMNMMGNDMVIKYKYNDKGAVASQSMDMGGQEMETPYTDYKYDAKGNWISRKSSMMGQEMEQTRTIEYYE
jgi:hypothetical protein